jgi:hypothetical protein
MMKNKIRFRQWTKSASGTRATGVFCFSSRLHMDKGLGEPDILPYHMYSIIKSRDNRRVAPSCCSPQVKELETQGRHETVMSICR